MNSVSFRVAGREGFHPGSCKQRYTKRPSGSRPARQPPGTPYPGAPVPVQDEVVPWGALPAGVRGAASPRVRRDQREVGFFGQREYGWSDQERDGRPRCDPLTALSLIVSSFVDGPKGADQPDPFLLRD